MQMSVAQGKHWIVECRECRGKLSYEALRGVVIQALRSGKDVQTFISCNAFTYLPRFNKIFVKPPHSPFIRINFCVVSHVSSFHPISSFSYPVIVQFHISPHWKVLHFDHFRFNVSFQVVWIYCYFHEFNFFFKEKM